MPKTKKTDLQVVQALLSMPTGKLTPSEKTAFQSMYDKLATGNIVRLSMRQRAWADEVYDKHDLDKERPAVKQVAVKDKSLFIALDNMPKPLMPPGRKSE